MIDTILNIIKKFIPERFFKFLQPHYHFLLAVLGNLIYRFPGRKLKVIGVTGTNGKTTTAILTANMLKEAGFKVGLVTSNLIEVAGESIIKDSALGSTTLGRFKLQKLLRKMVSKGAEWVVLEVTSQGLEQHRVLGIPFDVAIFTNLTHEHMELHGTMEAYRDAKAKLFKGLGKSYFKGVQKTIIVNADDKYGKFYMDFKAARRYSVSLGAEGLKGSIVIKAIDLNPTVFGTDFSVEVGGEKQSFHLGLPGSFNVSNALMAIAVGDALNISAKAIKSALMKAEGIDGRMQRIDMGQGFNVYVDYAFTPNAFRMVLGSVREITKGKIITVFGAPGNRDVQKRPLMGNIVTKLSDVVIITDDEPATDDPEKIIDDIKKGINLQNFEVIRDRKEAINKAIQNAKAGDSVIIAGLGPSTVRYTGKKAEAWDDREVVREILRKNSKNSKAQISNANFRPELKSKESMSND